MASPPDVAPPTPTSTTDLLQLPTARLERTLPPGAGCGALADAGWTAQCGQIETAGGPVVWVIEAVPAAEPVSCTNCTPKRVYVFVPSGAEQWDLALVASDDIGHAFVYVTATAVALPSGGSDLVVAARRTGSGAALDVDVVSGRSIVAHPDTVYDSGYAQLSPGRIDLFGRLESPGVAHAGWTYREHDVLDYAGGHWTLQTTTSPTPLPSPTGPLSFYPY
ncbi:MAG TPA: hypothetical protein VFW71_01680 [Actinomycetota bacterium]|nr:hypothetical protein [Actinomycetota bacterium]